MSKRVNNKKGKGRNPKRERAYGHPTKRRAGSVDPETKRVQRYRPLGDRPLVSSGK